MKGVKVYNLHRPLGHLAVAFRAELEEQGMAEELHKSHEKAEI